ncbi:MAG: aminoglycoside phosphotransferase family protein [bacterium]
METRSNNIIDSRLPQLPWVLDETFMLDFFREHFSREMSSGSGELNACTIIGKRYKPGKRCIVTYALDFASLPRAQILYTRIESPGNAAKKQARLKAKGADLLPALGMYVWRFPHDPKLESLAELTAADDIEKILTDLRIFDSNGSGHRRELSVEPLNYVPRRHCALVVEMNHGPSGKCTKVFGKTYGDDRGARVYSVMQRLWQQTLAQPKAFGVVEPLAYDDRRKVLWQRWTNGSSFLQFARAKGLSRACVMTARALADLHRSKLEDLPEYTREESFNKLLGRTKLLTHLYPRIQPRIERLLARLRGSERFWNPSMQTTIHGDFNDSQLLFEPGKVVMVDFDSVSLGDPLYDVAHFIAGLHRLAAQEYFSTSEIEQVIGLFTSLYREFVSWEVSDEALNSQIATALLCRRAYKVLRQLEKNAGEKVEFYLNLAQHYLGQRKARLQTVLGQA